MPITAATLRELLSTSPLTLAEIEKKLGKLPRPVTTYAKEFRPIVLDGEKHYTLASLLPQGDARTATPAKKKASKRAKGKRLQGFKAQRRKMKELAREHTRRPAAPAVPPIRDLARDNYIAALEGLAAVTIEQVDDIKNCVPLATQLANVERAKQLYQAAA